jgi:archaellin
MVTMEIMVMMMLVMMVMVAMMAAAVMMMMMMLTAATTTTTMRDSEQLDTLSVKTWNAAGSTHPLGLKFVSFLSLLYKVT